MMKIIFLLYIQILFQRNYNVTLSFLIVLIVLYSIVLNAYSHISLKLNTAVFFIGVEYKVCLIKYNIFFCA